MNNRLVICALGASPPGTMGGNTKIAIEMARCLSMVREVHVFLPQHKLSTFTDNLPADHAIVFHTLEDYPGDDKIHPLGSSRWYLTRTRALFRELAVTADDFVFGCSDFHVDVLPLYPLQREFGFRWLPSVFLFVPFVTENLARGYRFPPVKYAVYWLYQRLLFTLMKRRATGFVVTGKSDFGKFPHRFAKRLFAYYGGVNVEQIPRRAAPASPDRPFSVVFCSRLHPQKGVDAFLDVWRRVLDWPGLKRPLRLSVIGNGAPAYERQLRRKAQRLGLAASIDWLGYVNNEAKYAIYAASDLFVHPTVFDNNGMVAAEALCTGLPVVMQDLPALRDVYTTGCRKVPFGDRDAFAQAIAELASDPGKLAALAPSPDQVAELRTRWNWSARAKEFDKWLEGL